MSDNAGTEPVKMLTYEEQRARREQKYQAATAASSARFSRNVERIRDAIGTVDDANRSPLPPAREPGTYGRPDPSYLKNLIRR